MSVFVRVAELRSLSTAARQFGVTPSAVSKTLAKFEAHLGVQLVHRTTRQVSLTEDGRIFFDRCKRILADVREAELEASSARNVVRGRVRVSVASGIDRWLLAPRLTEFLEKHRDLNIEFVQAERVGDLIAESIDVAINCERLADSPLVQRVLGRFETCLVASPAYLKQAGLPNSLEALSRHTCVLDTRDTDGGEWSFGLDEQLKTVKVASRASASTDEGLLNLARAGQGVVRVLKLAAAQDLASGSLVQVLADQKSPQRTVYAAYPQVTHASPRVRALIEWVSQLSPAERAAPTALPIVNGSHAANGTARKPAAKAAGARARLA